MLFRFLHVSDTHFCVEPKRANVVSLFRRNLLAYFDAVVHQANEFGVWSLMRPASYLPEVSSGIAEHAFRRARVLDAIIYSGDLATTGIATDLNTARTFVEGPVDDGFVTSNGEPTLGAAKRPIHMVPGNHDTYADNKATPGSPNFGLTFQKYLKNWNKGVGHRLIAKGEERLAIISADFTLRTRRDASDPWFKVYGQGRVYDDVLNELIARTKALGANHKSLGIIWLVHFAPYHCDTKIELRGFTQLQKAARDCKVHAILCGHTHEVAKVEVYGVPTYCAGSAASIDKEGMNAIHEIEFSAAFGGWSVRRDTFRWQSELGQFAKAESD